MKLPPRRLQILLGLAVTSGVLAVTAHRSGDSDADVVAPVVRDRNAARPAPANAGATAARTPRTGNETLAALTPPNRAEVQTDAAGNPFRQSNWAPPPPPPPKPVAPLPPPPPPPPKAPPLPYAFVGMLEAKNTKPRAFLSKGDALVIVSQGDTLDNQYKVESLTSYEVVLTYLPLNQRQTIPLSGGR